MFSLAKKNGCILIDAIKTAYATAFARLILLAKEGKIGDIYSVDAVCTSLRPMTEDSWNSICGWGPTAMLPIFDILGTEYRSKNISSLIDKNGNDQFTKVDFSYDHAVASLKVGKGVKSEGELIISGTKVIYMFQHLGGKQIILKFVMRIQRRINGIFINWMVKVSDMSWLHS
ncbi:MAG: hypothetical protein ACLS61_08975 [Ruminococcus sp.]